MCNYFSMLAVSKRHALGIFWCICSTLKMLILAQYQVDIKQFADLKKLIKKLTEDDIKKKPGIFLRSKIKDGLTLLFDENMPRDLL